MRFFSMFSGIGTGEQGIAQAYKKRFRGQSDSDGYFADTSFRADDEWSSSWNGSENATCDCIGFSEIDRHAEAIYKFHHPNHKKHGDATKLVPSELPDFDFLIGGFPCQAFSIAGKRLGFEDTRGTLFFEIARVLREKRPSHFLLENVAGLLSHDNGSTFRTIVSALDEIGYDLEWTVINSKDHGVPQNRERVFIIGHPRNGSCGQVFSFGGSDEETFGERGNHGVASTIRNGELCETGDVALALDANYHKGPDNHGQRTVIGTLRTHKDGKGFREMKSNIAPALNARARQDGSQQAVIQIIGEIDEQKIRPDQILSDLQVPDVSKAREGRRSSINSPLHEASLLQQDPPSLWVLRNAQPEIQEIRQSADVQTESAQPVSRIRRLTVVECERLQGCPDDFSKYGRYGDEVKEVADTNRYKGLGNAFSVPVIEAIITAMREAGCLD